MVAEQQNTTPPSDAVPPKSKPKYGLVRRVLRAVFWSFLLTFTTIAIVFSALFTWLDSSSGRYWLVDGINRSGLAQVGAIEGSFWSELKITQLKVKTESVAVNLDYGVLRWEPYLLLIRDLSIPRVSLGVLEITTPPTPPDHAPSEAPKSLSLPLGLHLAQLNIVQLKINGSVLNDIAGSISSNGRFHRIHLNQLLLPQGKLAAALNITGKAPFHSAGSFVFAGQLEGQDFQSYGQVEGPLRDLNLELTVEHAKLKARAKLKADVFAPYAYQMVSAGKINVQGLNPQLWHAGAPKALLDFDADFVPNKNGVVAAIQLSNLVPGPLDRQALPLTQLSMQLAINQQQLQIKQAKLQFGAQAKLLAQGQISQGQLQLNLHAEEINPQQFWSPQPQGRMNGQFQLAGPWLSPGIKGEINDVQRAANLKLDIGWINPKTERRLAIRQAQLSRGGAQLAAQGEFNLLGKNDFKAELSLKNINPAEYFSVPKGSIAGEFKLKGALQPKPSLELQYELKNSLFNAQPLLGDGQLSLVEQNLKWADLWLGLGANKLSAKGKLGSANDQLNLVVQMPSLATLGSQFRGSLTANLNFSGALLQPRINGQAQIDQLHTPFDFSVHKAQLSVAMGADLSGPISVLAKLEKLNLANTQMDVLNAEINGSLAQHRVQVHAAGRHEQWPLALDLLANGTLNAQQAWRGQLLTLSGQAALPFKLQNSPILQLSKEKFELASTDLLLGQSQMHLETTRWSPGLLETQGKIRAISAKEWLSVAKISNPSSDLVLVGDWNIKKTAVLNGQFNLKRISGDVLYSDESKKKIALTLNDLNLAAQVEMNHLAAQGGINTAQYGQIAINADGQLDMAKVGLNEAAPFNVAVKGNLPNFAVFAPFIGPSVKLGGSALIDIKRQGSLATPQFSGGIQIKDLAYSDSQLGLKLQQGSAQIALANQQISLQKFSARGAGTGEVSATGAIDLSSGKANGYLNVLAKHFTLLSKPEMLLVISGDGSLNVKENELSVLGSFKADSADIQFQATDVPTLSKDVIVIGREKPERQATAMKLQMQVDIDLGSNFTFRGYGLDSRLQGRLRLKAHPNSPLTATGTINTEEGEYKAYGQNLEIERGILSFQGMIDNPSLDILAVRRNQAVEAGVQVKGSAYAPRVSLYSEPSVPDSEKISWLLFGHGSESMGKGDSALALQLLNAMAGDGSGHGLSDEILSNFGIDEVGYKSKEESDGTTTQVVTVSKRLTKTLRVALEKSFNGLRDAVAFTLQLSRNWSVVSRIGVDDSSVDVNYTLSFD